MLPWLIVAALGAYIWKTRTPLRVFRTHQGPAAWTQVRRRRRRWL